MIHLHRGSHAYKLIMLLSLAGEYPLQSISLLGNERVYKVLLQELTQPQTFRNPYTREDLSVAKVFTISGKGKEKTLRLYKGAFPLLRWFGAEDYYRQSFRENKFPSDPDHRDRNHRVGEALAMNLLAGIECRPYLLPKLQNEQRLNHLPQEPIFYPAKTLKQIGCGEENKTSFTRLVGAIFAHGASYAVYNTRDAVMKWSGKGEFKALQTLIGVGRLNAGIEGTDSAILFAKSDEVILETLRGLEQNHRLELRFDSIYRHIHYIPMTESGIRQLRLLSVPDWKENLLDVLFEPNIRSYDRGLFEYDAVEDGVYLYSYFDGDIARLARFRAATFIHRGRYRVFCYPHQEALIREYLGNAAQVMTFDQGLVAAELGVKRRNCLEE